VNFLPFKILRPTLKSAQLPSQRVAGLLYPELKRPGREVDHLPAPSGENKSERNITSATLYGLMAGPEQLYVSSNLSWSHTIT
jgi:hypothetical protein